VQRKNLAFAYRRQGVRENSRAQHEDGWEWSRLQRLFLPQPLRRMGGEAEKHRVLSAQRAEQQSTSAPCLGKTSSRARHAHMGIEIATVWLHCPGRPSLTSLSSRAAGQPGGLRMEGGLAAGAAISRSTFYRGDFINEQEKSAATK